MDIERLKEDIKQARSIGCTGDYHDDSVRRLLADIVELLAESRAIIANPDESMDATKWPQDLPDSDTTAYDPNPPPDEVAEAMDVPDFSVESNGISMAAIGAVDRKHHDTLAATVRQLSHAYELLYCAADEGFDENELVGERAALHAGAHITAAKVEEMNE